jgi:hypothetical protein
LTQRTFKTRSNPAGCGLFLKALRRVSARFAQFSGARACSRTLGGNAPHNSPEIRPLRVLRAGFSSRFALRAGLFVVRANDFALRAGLFAVRANDFALRAGLFVVRANDFALRAGLFVVRANDFALRAGPFAVRADDFALCAGPFAVRADDFALRAGPFAVCADDFAFRRNVRDLRWSPHSTNGLRRMKACHRRDQGHQSAKANPKKTADPGCYSTVPRRIITAAQK